MMMNLASTAIGAGGAPRHRRGGRSRLVRSEQEDPAKWIWIPNADPVRNSYIYARKTFKLSAAPDRAIIKVSADSKYKLYINSTYIGKGPVRSDIGYTYYDSYDITELLAKGNNVIAIHAHHFGEPTYSYALGRPGFICRLEMETGEERTEIGTDDTWKVRRAADWTDSGARLSHRLGFQEVYDAEKAIENWNAMKLSERGWENAVVIGTVPNMPWGEFRPREVPALREEKITPLGLIGTFNSPEVTKETSCADMPDIMAQAELAPIKSGSVKNAEILISGEGEARISTPRGDKGVVILLDFGREVFGNVEVGIAGSARGCIDLGYSELLQDGHVKPNRGDTRYTDRILLKKGRLEWQSFEPRAFRYMQIEFRRCSKPVMLEYIRVNQTTYPIQYTGSFECNDRLLNEIWETGAYTARLCMEDTFIDCPWRERAEWWGDARIASRVAYYAFDDTTLLAQGLRQIASTQCRDGAIPGLYPVGGDVLVPDFSLFWVFSILDYFAFADDAELVRDLYPVVRRLMNWFARYQDTDGLLANVPGRLFIDEADLERSGEVTALNCLYYQGLRVAAIIASIAEKQEDAEEYIQAANHLRILINKYMYVPKRGLYAEGRQNGKLVEKFSRQTNILAALFDITDQYQKSVILRQMANGSLPAIATPYFASHYLEALYSGDQHEQALSYIRRKWGDMIKAGATTFWEDFNGQGSLCHVWSACPTRDLIAEYVGIKPVPGSHRFAVTPHPADLKWARGSVATKFGTLVVDWRMVRNCLTISIDVPSGLKVDVYPPGPPDSTISVDGKGLHSRFVTLGSGSHRVRVCAPRPPKPATYDEALKPPQIPHVELLEDVSPFGRRRLTRAESRRKSTRPRKGEKRTPIADIPAPGEIAPEVEIVKLPQAEEISAPEPFENIEAAEAAEPVEAIEINEAAEVTETEEEPKKKRRPRRRGGRRHSKSRHGEPAEPQESAPETGSANEPTAEPAVEPAQAPETEHPAPKPAREEPVPDTEPASEEPAEEKPKKKRRSYTRRGGSRRRKNGSKPEGEAGVENTESGAEPAAESEPTQLADQREAVSNSTE